MVYDISTWFSFDYQWVRFEYDLSEKTKTEKANYQKLSMITINKEPKYYDNKIKKPKWEC